MRLKIEDDLPIPQYAVSESKFKNIIRKFNPDEDFEGRFSNLDARRKKITSKTLWKHIFEDTPFDLQDEILDLIGKVSELESEEEK